MELDESWIEEAIARELEQLSVEDLENEDENNDVKNEPQDLLVRQQLN